jgi:hypothetical protein
MEDDMGMNIDHCDWERLAECEAQLRELACNLDHMSEQLCGLTINMENLMEEIKNKMEDAEKEEK